jgi:hypothetical protein
MRLKNYFLSFYINHVNRKLMRSNFESFERMVGKINELLSNGALENIQHAQFCDGNDTILFYRSLKNNFSLKVINTNKLIKYQVINNPSKNILYSISKENRRDYIEISHSLSFYDIELSIFKLIKSSIPDHRISSIYS